MSLSPAQCRAARALLNCSQEELVAPVKITKKTIADFCWSYHPAAATLIRSSPHSMLPASSSWTVTGQRPAKSSTPKPPIPARRATRAGSPPQRSGLLAEAHPFPLLSATCPTIRTRSTVIGGVGRRGAENSRPEFQRNAPLGLGIVRGTQRGVLVYSRLAGRVSLPPGVDLTWPQRAGTEWPTSLARRTVRRGVRRRRRQSSLQSQNPNLGGGAEV